MHISDLLNNARDNETRQRIHMNKVNGLQDVARLACDY